jgi:hypothetical protein
MRSATLPAPTTSGTVYNALQCLRHLDKTVVAGKVPESIIQGFEKSMSTIKSESGAWVRWVRFHSMINRWSNERRFGTEVSPSTRAKPLKAIAGH